ncbi:hypothetical protein [Pseudobutyrivibrio xylanivorans]|uniref:Uncharacterized protein n=1 Tax=Pseudobutyrivibrio xylanivorans DSM 14809 TaxID=1123012 RepID=A0A1M6EPC1_PSEXY|nr:hypothetical protein [Pseudobutyrivibrio xylanivorans]SHI87335.1 hypothetical protein SAMN02745725_01287 [Pseudobutyrivibrio xylanivorans DSM 14809]
MNIGILEKELNEIDESIKKLRLREKEVIKSSNSVVVKKGNGVYQYYYRDGLGNLTYIPSRNNNYAKELVQRDYYNKLMDKLQEQKSILEKFIKRYEENPIDAVYEKFCKGRQILIEPLRPIEQEFVNQWLDEHPGNQNPFEKRGTYLTNRGEYVRSKSEKILADLFYQMGIPYQYEASYVLYNGKICYPDFILLNKRDRKIFYWEHFGLASDKDYAETNLEKLLKYEKSELVLGDNLIVSFESNGISFDVKLIEEKIKTYLL